MADSAWFKTGSSGMGIQELGREGLPVIAAWSRGPGCAAVVPVFLLICTLVTAGHVVVT